MTTFSKLKNSDNHIKHTVFGYLREFQNKKCLNIPLAICQLCLQYYYVSEYFQLANSNFIQISSDKLTATNIRGFNMDSIYLNQWIHSTSNQICIWKIKINHKQDSWGYVMQFGLTSKEITNGGEFCTKADVPNYGFRSDFYRIKDGCILNKDDTKHKSSKMFQSNDTLTLVLDLVKMTFICLINNKERLRFENIKRGNHIKYKMAFTLLNRNDCITLEQYQEIYK